MVWGTEPTAAGRPDPDDLRRQVTRGQLLTVALGEGTTIEAATTIARDLAKALRPDFTVFANPRAGGPILTVIRLLTEPELAALRPGLDRLLTAFRREAHALVALLPSVEGDEEYPEFVRHRDAIWYVDPHGEHCRFENESTGEIVEAQLYDPDRVDPYFLLEFARTAGGHDAVLEACVHGFHDMCRLLDHAGITYR